METCLAEVKAAAAPGPPATGSPPTKRLARLVYETGARRSRRAPCCAGHVAAHCTARMSELGARLGEAVLVPARSCHGPCCFQHAGILPRCWSAFGCFARGSCCPKQGAAVWLRRRFRCVQASCEAVCRRRAPTSTWSCCASCRRMKRGRHIPRRPPGERCALASEAQPGRPRGRHPPTCSNRLPGSRQGPPDANSRPRRALRAEAGRCLGAGGDGAGGDPAPARSAGAAAAAVPAGAGPLEPPAHAAGRVSGGAPPSPHPSHCVSPGSVPPPVGPPSLVAAPTVVHLCCLNAT